MVGFTMDKVDFASNLMAFLPGAGTGDALTEPHRPRSTWCWTASTLAVIDGIRSAISRSFCRPRPEARAVLVPGLQ